MYAQSPITSEPPTADVRRRFDALRDAAREAARRGRYQRALRLCDQALVVAGEIAEPHAVDLAVCNRASVLLTLGEYCEVRAPMREVLMRNASAESAFMAAYNLSRSYELTKGFKKGLFYARVARNHARASANTEWLVYTDNQRGNCLLGDSFFEEAAAAYREALDLLPDEPSVVRATLLHNLGYCSSVLGRPEEAFRLTFKSLRWFRRLGAEADLPWAHLDLCYAYLQVDRVHHARRHGTRALAMAERAGDRDLIKNALFLLGEAERLADNLDAAYDHFDRLQRAFYPDQPQLVELMLAVDMRQMVNLRA